MNANVLYFWSSCKPTFSGATREWDATVYKRYRPRPEHRRKFRKYSRSPTYFQMITKRVNLNWNFRFHIRKLSFHLISCNIECRDHSPTASLNISLFNWIVCLYAFERRSSNCIIVCRMEKTVGKCWSLLQRNGMFGLEPESNLTKETATANREEMALQITGKR
jgi:hypothetical protein